MMLNVLVAAWTSFVVGVIVGLWIATKETA
jgi:uncharacterized protein YneF (UPF0154 family)